MTINLIDNQEAWDRYITEQNGSFSQSFAWGEILLSEGKKIERLALENDGKTVAQAQVVYINLPFGWKYAFCPKGPVGEIDIEILKIFSDYLKKQKVIFWRLEPEENIADKNFIKSIDINPRATLILDLEKSEEELLTGMHPKTRYNIRLAQKKDLKIKEEKNLEIFLRLMKKTARRDKFTLHQDSHYKAILKSELTRQLVVYAEDKAIATVVLLGYGETFTYLFGASDHDHRQLMAPYLLQWEAIKIGKSLGYKKYDLYGVAPRVNFEGKEYFDPEHQYAGVTRFKAGLGGNFVEAPGTFDFVIDRGKYNLYLFLRKLRRLV